MSEALAPHAADGAHRDLEPVFLFAAWPQAIAHPSWLESLDQAAGTGIARRCDWRATPADEAVAVALLEQAGLSGTEVVAVEQLPAWALQTHAAMRRVLASAAGVILAPDLRRAVTGAAARHWDALLGDGVRATVLRLCRGEPTDALADPPLARDTWQQLRDTALTASRSDADWERLCLRIALGLLAGWGSAVQRRVCLAWPQVLHDAEPLSLDEPARAWLEAVIAAADQALRASARPSATIVPPTPAAALPGGPA